MTIANMEVAHVTIRDKEQEGPHLRARILSSGGNYTGQCLRSMSHDLSDRIKRSGPLPGTDSTLLVGDVIESVYITHYVVSSFFLEGCVYACMKINTGTICGEVMYHAVDNGINFKTSVGVHSVVWHDGKVTEGKILSVSLIMDPGGLRGDGSVCQVEADAPPPFVDREFVKARYGISRVVTLD